MNKILAIHLQRKHEWEGCGLCMISLEFSILDKYLFRNKPTRKYLSINNLNPNIKAVILEKVCKDLKKITSKEIFNLVKYKKHRGNIRTVDNSDFFFTDVGYFIWGMVIVYIDTHMQNRSKLHALLDGSLANSYLRKMEDHSGDYGVT